MSGASAGWVCVSFFRAGITFVLTAMWASTYRHARITEDTEALRGDRTSRLRYGIALGQWTPSQVLREAGGGASC